MSLAGDKAYTLKAGKYIRNVVGSSWDPKLKDYSDWISPWRKCTGQTGLQCCICNRADNSISSSGHRIIGGHIVLGSASDVSGGAAKNGTVLKYENRVFIAPICDVCNQYSGNMKLAVDTEIMHLCGFMLNWYPREEVEYLAATCDKGSFQMKARRIIAVHTSRVADIIQTQSTLNVWDAQYIKSAVVSATSAGSTFSAVSVLSTGSTSSTVSVPSTAYVGARHVKSPWYGYGHNAYYWGG